jgi:hypothetical protein
MASWTYAVSTKSPNEIEKHGPERAAEVEVPGDWTSRNATHWARVEGCKLPEGTVIVVWRWRDAPGRLPRQGHGEQHRRYLVGDDGIVRRTDR